MDHPYIRNYFVITPKHHMGLQIKLIQSYVKDEPNLIDTFSILRTRSKHIIIKLNQMKSNQISLVIDLNMTIGLIYLTFIWLLQKAIQIIL